MSKKIVVVFGATGKQGGSIINSLLSDPTTRDAFEIHGVTRDPTKASAQSLKEKGVTPVKGDLSDAASLTNVLTSDVYAAFALTNYWEHMDMKLEFEQGKAFADACKNAGVKHVIWSSLINVNKATNGVLKNVHHFDSKNDVEQYIRQQNIPATFFYPGFYMQNLPDFISKTDNGLLFACPVPDDALFPLFDVTDSGKWVKAILKKGLADGVESINGHKVYSGTDYFTPKQIVEAVTKATGKETVFKTLSEEDFRGALKKAGMPDFGIQETYENMLLLRKEYGYYSGDSLQPALDMLEEKPTTLVEYFTREKKAWE